VIDVGRRIHPDLTVASTDCQGRGCNWSLGAVYDRSSRSRRHLSSGTMPMRLFRERSITAATCQSVLGDIRKPFGLCDPLALPLDSPRWVDGAESPLRRHRQGGPICFGSCASAAGNRGWRYSPFRPFGYGRRASEDLPRQSYCRTPAPHDDHLFKFLGSWSGRLVNTLT
jgi:hypothetical protein